MVDGAPGAWISTQDGRHDLARELRRAVGEYRTVVLTGAPGTGKTLLLDGLAFELRADGTTVHQVRCLPALQDRRLGALDALVDSGGDAERLVRAVDRDDVVVVDDLQWMDPDSLAALATLHGYCAVVAGSLPIEARSTPQHGLSAVAHPVRIGALDPLATARLVEAYGPDLLPEERNRIVSASAGNPFHAGLLVAFADTERSAPPASMSVHVDRAAALLARLGREERITLGALGRAGTALPAACLPGRIGLLAGLDLVVVDDDRVSLACEPLGRPEVQLLDDDEVAAVTALVASADALDDVVRARALADAGDLVGASELARDVAGRPVEPGTLAEALRIAATVERRRRPSSTDHQLDGEVQDLLIAAAAALNGDLRHREALEVLSGTAWSDDRQGRATIELMYAATNVGDRAVLADVIGRVGSTLSQMDPPVAESMRSWVARMTLGDRAAAERRRGDIVGTRDFLVRAALDATARQASDEDPGSGPRSTGAPVHDAFLDAVLRDELDAARNHAMILVNIGLHAEAQALARSSAARADAAGSANWRSEFTTIEMMSRFHAGAANDEALAWFSTVRTAPVRVNTRAVATVGLVTALADRGEVDRSGAILEPWLRVVESFDVITASAIGWAAVQRAWILGDLSSTIDLARSITERSPDWVPGLAGLQVAWRWAEFESGVPITAPMPTGGLLDCATLEATAIDLAAAGRHDEAATQFEVAASSWDRILVRCALRCRWARGVQLGRSGDRTTAEEVLTDLDGSLDGWGSPALRPRVRAALAEVAGRPVAATRSRGDIVTGRERAVLLLVAEGLTSVEIGTRLGVSPTTVDSHVRSAVRKLGARNRRHAAALIDRRPSAEMPSG